MHDIKSIRDNPPGLRRRPEAPRPGRRCRPALLAIDESAVRRSWPPSRRRRGAMRRRRKSATPRRPRTRRAPAKLMAEVAELKTTMPELEAGREDGATRNWPKELCGDPEPAAGRSA